MLSLISRISEPCLNNRKAHQNASKMQRHIRKDRKTRYYEKLRFIGGADPYELAPSSWIPEDPVILPSVAYPDIVNYLVRRAHTQRKTLNPTKVWRPITKWCADG